MFNSNFYLILFGALVLIDFVLFHWGVFTLLFAKGEVRKMQKGRRILVLAFFLLFIILLIIFIFYAVNYLFKKPETVPLDLVDYGEFPPPLHIGTFPPAPEFIQIGRYYFSGTEPLREIESIKDAVLYVVLCKNSQEYGKIYIERAGNIELSEHEKYQCWLENCAQNLSNLYLAIIPVLSEGYTSDKVEKIKNSLKNQFDFACLEQSD